jgi:hypothetical protein
LLFLFGLVYAFVVLLAARIIDLEPQQSNQFTNNDGETLLPP